MWESRKYGTITERLWLLFPATVRENWRSPKKNINWLSEDYIPRVELRFQQIIFNVPHQSKLLHVKDKHTRMMLIMMVQETKRDMIFQRMDLPPLAQQVADPQCLAAHLEQVI